MFFYRKKMAFGSFFYAGLSTGERCLMMMSIVNKFFENIG
jgi:hypothetical protein